MRQLVWYLQYVETTAEDSELYCYNTEGDKNSVISQVSCRMDVTRLVQLWIMEMWKFTHGEAGDIRRLLHIAGSD
jgi:hypothetical protein